MRCLLSPGYDRHNCIEDCVMLLICFDCFVLIFSICALLIFVFYLWSLYRNIRWGLCDSSMMRTGISLDTVRVFENSRCFRIEIYTHSGLSFQLLSVTGEYVKPSFTDVPFPCPYLLKCQPWPATGFPFSLLDSGSLFLHGPRSVFYVQLCLYQWHLFRGPSRHFITSDWVHTPFSVCCMFYLLVGDGKSNFEWITSLPLMPTYVDFTYY